MISFQVWKNSNFTFLLSFPSLLSFSSFFFSSPACSPTPPCPPPFFLYFPHQPACPAPFGHQPAHLRPMTMTQELIPAHLLDPHRPPLFFLHARDQPSTDVTEPPKNEGFVSQDHIGGFSTKRECANTHK
jgi:hypothetical protein